MKITASPPYPVEGEEITCILIEPIAKP